MEGVPEDRELVDKGVDTSDLGQAVKGLTLGLKPGKDLAGKGKEEIEAAAGDIRGKWEEIPGSSEWIWVEDPWTGKWEQVKVPHEEAERRRRQGLKPRPSYWGETESKEWRCRLREEREAVAREIERKKARHLAELQKMGVHPDRGWQMSERGRPYGDGATMKRHFL